MGHPSDLQRHDGLIATEVQGGVPPYMRPHPLGRSTSNGRFHRAVGASRVEYRLRFATSGPPSAERARPSGAGGADLVAWADTDL